jgi:DNA-directed RNA polymerase beta subunit
MQLTYKAQGKKLRKVSARRQRLLFLMSIYSLISHQINSYNDFIKNGLQKGFDSSGGIIVEPKENGDGEWRKLQLGLERLPLTHQAFGLVQQLMNIPSSLGMPGFKTWLVHQG